MRNRHLVIFFLAIALISCTGSKKHFEWVKVNSSAYLQNQPTPTTGQNLESKEIQITVYLKERSAVNYFEKSDEFFNHIPVAPTDRNFDKKSLFAHVSAKTNLGNSNYIYRDEDIEESKLNSGLKELEKNAITQSGKIHSGKKETKNKEQSLFNDPAKRLWFLGAIGFLVCSLLIWMFFRRKAGNTDENGI